MYKTFIVEDESTILKYLKYLLLSNGEIDVIGTYNLPEEALEDFVVKAPDLVFLDIQMPRMNGIELATRMLSMNNKVKIVFLTAYSDYAVDAFKVEAFDYLLKPITNEDITRVIKRIRKNETKAAEIDLVKGQLYTPPVKCFGCFEVLDKNNNIMKWPTKKTEEIFAYMSYNKGNYISKWTLVDMLWPDMIEKKALNNLYSTIYRLKTALQEIPFNPHIDTINSGYILNSDNVLSDVEFIKMLENRNENIENCAIVLLEKIFYTYQVPLFGTKDYIWSIPYQERIASSYRMIYIKLLKYYQTQNELEAIIRIIRYFALNHIEDEEMLIKGVIALHEIGGSMYQINTNIEWINKRLDEQDLPNIHIKFKIKL